MVTTEIIQKYLISIFLLMLGSFSCKAKTFGNKHTPNVILIYADDLGRGLLGYEGQQISKTPNIDISFEMDLKAGSTKLITTLFDQNKNALCSAPFVSVKLVR